MSVSFRTNSVEMDRLLHDPDGPVGRELERIATKVESAAKRKAPVDTGRLRASIHHEGFEDAAGLGQRIGSDVEYAIYQEVGTRHQTGKPYLRPALHEVVG